MRLLTLTAGNEKEFGERIRALESGARYPLGSDYFRLEHGVDYFAFFRRLGDLRAYALEIDGQIACAASAVLRTVRRVDGSTLRAWYLCDLKVAPEFRGRRLPARLFSRVFLPLYLRCPRGFAISMNPGDGSPNRVVRILEQFPWVPLRAVAELGFYVWSESELGAMAHALSAELGAWQLRSLCGLKDLILESTGMPWQLYHIEGEKCLRDSPGGAIALRATHGGAHMLCVPRGGTLARRIEAAGYRRAATATIVAHRMKHTDWGSVASSEI